MGLSPQQDRILLFGTMAWMGLADTDPMSEHILSDLGSKACGPSAHYKTE